MTPTARRALIAALGKIVGPSHVFHERRDLALYGYDATTEVGRPDLAVLPDSTEQVSAIVRLAREHELPVVPRGGGTSLSGGPVAVAGGLVVALTRMDKILELDFANQRAVVQPGVINQDLLTAAQQVGCLYAPDPASQCACTLGGNVGENSGGPHCLKYGVTTNHILGLEMVLPDGEVLVTGGKALDGPGYDITGAIVGSEGTFGIVTAITCRLLPAPQAVRTMLAIFDSLDDASRTVSGIIAAGLLPATLEMMDKPLIHAVQMGFDAGYPEDAEAVLIIEIDGLVAGMDRQLSRIQEVCEEHGVRKFEWADSAAERARLWRGRKGAFGAVANISPNKLSTDVTVPRTELPAVLAEVMRIGARHGLRVGNVFHAGDGNLHPQVMYDVRDPEQVERIKVIDREIVECALAHGGVLTGEHGIGSTKRKWMPAMFSAADLRALWALKDVFDPGGGMNPQKVLPDRGELAPPVPISLPRGDFATAAPRLAPLDEGGIACPLDAEAVAKLLALASREGQRVVIRGGGTKSGAAVGPGKTSSPAHWGGPGLAAPVISTLGLRRILLRDPQNMTIKAEAGARWQELQEAAAEDGQFVPLKPARPAEATVGGVIATNAAGPHRLRYGACRDLVTGVRVALPCGEVIVIGSSCVKNVSGYALDKLFLGSRGSLGAILDATFRTFPLPEAKRTLCYHVGRGAGEGPSALAAFAAQAVGGPLLPATLEALTASLADLAARAAGVALSAPRDGWLVAVGLEGLREEVAGMAEAFDALAGQHGLEGAGPVEQAAHDLFWESVTQVGSPALQATSRLSEAVALGEDLLAQVGEAPLRVGLGTGLVVCAPRAEEATDAGARLSAWDALAAAHGGRAGWLPPAPEGCPAWPTLEGPVAEINRRVKAAFDPAGILP